MTPPIPVPLSRLEGRHLARLVREFTELLSSDDQRDPAMGPLAPDPYPDDPDAGREFTRLTRADVLDRRRADAAIVLDTLSPFEETTEASVDEESLAEEALTIPASHVEPWLRTLTALRLVLATRLGIATEDDRPEYGRPDVYDWLGYRLELLVEAADAADGHLPH